MRYAVNVDGKLAMYCLYQIKATYKQGSYPGKTVRAAWQQYKRERQLTYKVRGDTSKSVKGILSIVDIGSKRTGTF